MLLNIPSIQKNTTIQIFLNKEELFSLPLVLSDSYFSISSNVKTCYVEYNSDPGNQRHILKFDLSQNSPSDSIVFSSTARSLFLLDRIILEDFDKGTLIIERSNLPSGLDITVS
jgi:hypothetical protein